MSGALVTVVFATLVGFAAVSGLSRDERDDSMVEIRLERVEYTITLPPDHNARATYGIEARLRVRRRNEVEARRRLEFFKPRLQDALQGILAQYHYSSLDREDAKAALSVEVREAVNAILGGVFVEDAEVVPSRAS